MAYGNGGNGKPKYEHKRDRGSMFENDHKEKDAQPDFTGSVNINGTIYWISGWKDMTAAGKRKISLAVKLQEERQEEQRPTQGRQAPPQSRRASW